MRQPVVSDYGFLSDFHSAALLSREGSVDWWCVPRFDSPSVFARLLDEDGGHWSIHPVGAYEAERYYVGDSLVLRTVFRAEGGSLAVTDALALASDVRGHDIGQRAPRALVRRVEGVDGEVDVEAVLAPRFEYGLSVPRFSWIDGGAAARVGPVQLRLETAVGLELGGGAARSRFTVAAGQAVDFCLTYCPTFGEGKPANHVAGAVGAALRNTVTAWESWVAEHSGYHGQYQQQVRRSALVLQGLTYQPSGAIVAAATTSLPEQVGGELNWDYRFTWVRDMALTLQAQWVAACPDEANRFFVWVSHAMGQLGNKPLQIMYGIEGERMLTEHTLDHLAGFQGSRPVRVGNAAGTQRQLDVLGEVLFAADILRDELGELHEDTRELLVSLANQAATDWYRSDAGMWEARDAQRHYTSSKVMCWVALDRAVILADRLGPDVDVGRWAKARDEIETAVLEQAWSEEAGAYAGAFGSDRLDASVLLLPLVGFLPADDPRMRATIHAVEDQLCDEGMVYRWRGDTATFVITSYWLVECLAMAGEVDRATQHFERITGWANDLGLLAEEVDLGRREQIGNFPQAFSHVGLINAAWRLTQMGARTA